MIKIVEIRQIYETVLLKILLQEFKHVKWQEIGKNHQQNRQSFFKTNEARALHCENIASSKTDLKFSSVRQLPK